MSVRSETDLLTSPRECIFCNKNGLHNYHMLVDHLHTKNKIVNRDIIRVRLDADCSFCQSVGRPTCCICIKFQRDIILVFVMIVLFCMRIEWLKIVHIDIV